MAHDISKWDTEKTAVMFEEGLPEVYDEDPKALKTKIGGRIRQLNLDGAKLLDVMRLTNVPDQPHLEEQPLFSKLFEGTDDLFKKAVTNVRGAHAFANVFFKKIMLSSTLVSAEGKKLLSEDMNEFRDAAYDALYASDERWGIAVGKPSFFEYTSKVCRPGDNAKAIHGFHICPSGWIKLALKPYKHFGKSDQEDMFRTWHKAYHGTDVKNVQKIMSDRLRIPKESIHGTAGANGKNVIYCSPCIEYSAHHVFTGHAKLGPADAQMFSDMSSKKCDLSSPGHALHQQHVQCVFEVRVHPDKYRVQGNTLSKTLWPNWFLEFDTTCNSKSLEWIIEDEDDIEVTGILIRELACSPNEWNEQRVARMEKIVGWQWDAKGEIESGLRTGKALRQRNHDGVPPGQAKWQWNSVDATKDTLSRDSSFPWTDYLSEVSEVLEEAYLSYQQYCFIGQPSGSPGPYYIDFQGWCEGTGAPIQKRADADNQQAWRQRAVRRVPKL